MRQFWRDGRTDPVRLLAATTLAVFFTELVIMFILPTLAALPYLGEALIDSTLLSLVISGVLYLSLFRPLAAQIKETAKAEGLLKQAHDRLLADRDRLVVRNCEIALFSTMSDRLQACSTEREVHEVISSYALQLFPKSSGALGLLTSSHAFVETAVSWGNYKAELAFPPDDCWALRYGRANLILDGPEKVRCGHLPGKEGVSQMCFPMLARGTTLGVLTLIEAEAIVGNPECGPFEHWSDERIRLAENVAENIGLSLANLRLQEDLRTQSIRDPLTGLYNRRHAGEVLDKEIRRAQRSGSHLAILLVDADHFKGINDGYGHEAGDVLLRQLSDLLQRQVRFEDAVFRYGGEEFLLVLVDATYEDAMERAEQIRRSISLATVQYEGEILPQITVSIGVSLFTSNGQSASELIRSADRALYEAKKNGRNRVEGVLS